MNGHVGCFQIFWGCLHSTGQCFSWEDGGYNSLSSLNILDVDTMFGQLLGLAIMHLT